ncbi:hypothetical protein IIE18_10400 [Pseudomonas sp. V1]|uniref:hypothetical protein n=1 Tax=Pseudomonas arcuscaelestis TaxID=2710591 RepID=UPI00193EC7E4|nr:hypothetical protein [Pseudomonas arcuscaelestis]MBM3105549.1 hypothetical protein [Pseudomonas arcuscaelestis]
MFGALFDAGVAGIGANDVFFASSIALAKALAIAGFPAEAASHHDFHGVFI